MKAKRGFGLGAREKSGRNLLQSVKFWCQEVDGKFLGVITHSGKLIMPAIGLVLICAGLTLFMIPFSLTATEPDGWKSVTIICMIVMGGMLTITFVLYEKFFREKMFFPFEFIKDRSVLGTYLLGLFSWISF